jgi:hypothetical protein
VQELPDYEQHARIIGVGINAAVGSGRYFGLCCRRRMSKHHAPNFLIPVSADIVEDVLAFHC